MTNPKQIWCDSISFGRCVTFKVITLKIFTDDPSPEQKSDFLDEIKLMKAVGSHKNIVSLIGCCTKSTPNFLIVEFAEKGDLLSYLRERRTKVKVAAYLCSIV